jgi:DNA-binding transcriptional MerR regulator
MKHSLGIGALARTTDTKVVTIRYYESVGLLPKPPRTKANYRLYGADHVERLSFIRRCRALGFTVEQIRQLLRLGSERERDCHDVDVLARSHLADVEKKIADLLALQSELEKVIKRCGGGVRVGECKILRALSANTLSTVVHT